MPAAIRSADQKAYDAGIGDPVRTESGLIRNMEKAKWGVISPSTVYKSAYSEQT